MWVVASRHNTAGAGQLDSARRMPMAARTCASGAKHPPQGGQLARDCARERILRILRLYGPTEAAIDNRWKPGDFKKVK